MTAATNRHIAYSLGCILTALLNHATLAANDVKVGSDTENDESGFLQMSTLISSMPVEATGNASLSKVADTVEQFVAAGNNSVNNRTMLEVTQNGEVQGHRLALREGIKFEAAGHESMHQQPGSPLGNCIGIGCVHQFINLPEPSYSWSHTGTSIDGVDEDTGVSWTAHFLNMTSLRWNTPDMPEQPLWWHTLAVVVPDNLEYGQWASITSEYGIDTLGSDLTYIVNRASSTNEMEVNNYTFLHARANLTEAVQKAAFLATHAHTVSAAFFNGVNTFQRFATDGQHRQLTGVDLKAFTYHSFLEHGASEPERLIELPTAKALVKAMDTVTAFTATLSSGAVHRYALMGEGDLGQAVWYVSALDPRVEASAPTSILPSLLVFNAAPLMGLAPWNGSLNTTAHPLSENYTISGVVPNTTATSQGLQSMNSLPLHASIPTLGGLAAALDSNPLGFLASWLGSQEFARMAEVVNPLSAISLQTRHKLIVMDTDNPSYSESLPQLALWWDQMPPPKRLLTVVGNPGDHIITRTLPQIASWLHGILLQEEVPYFISGGPAMMNAMSLVDPSAIPALEMQNTTIVARSVQAPVSVRFTAATSCHATPSLSFTGSFWNESHEDIVSVHNTAAGYYEWSVDLAPPGVTFDANATTYGPCARGGYLTFSYAWPTESQLFEMSTPLYFAMNPPVNRHGIPGRLSTAAKIIIIVSIFTILIGGGACYIYNPLKLRL